MEKENGSPAISSRWVLIQNNSFPKNLNCSIWDAQAPASDQIEMSMSMNVGYLGISFGSVNLPHRKNITHNKMDKIMVKNTGTCAMAVPSIVFELPSFWQK